MSRSTISFHEVQAVMPSELDKIVRKAAQKMITAAVEAECDDFISRCKRLKTDSGSLAVVLNGYHQERQVTVNAGSLSVKVPRTRNRIGGVNFSSNLIPKYMRRSTTIDEAIPLL